ncbi:hypothetical protein ACQEV4_01235 [Streptomyces shenzhenensis]|uniref:hypothetical protein n=1 Tax=Streptomyces shenzhenensis TaxID=943815 RepID=UPI003D8BE951
MAGSQRLRFILDGDDRLSRVLNHAGDSSARLHRRLNDDMDGNSRAVRGFTQDADGRLRDLRGRFLSVADASRMMANGMPDVRRRLDDVAGAGSGAAASLGQSGGGLGGVMLGVAAAAGLSLLPMLGALVPALVGAGAAAGTLKLGFSGIGDALEAQTKGHKEYAEALKKLPKPAQDFTKALVGVKKEFSGIGKDIQKAMLPGFTRAVKAAAPVVKILGKAMTEMGGQFGKAAEGVGRLLKDSGFQDTLQTNLKLGAVLVKDMTTGVGRLTRSLLDFGAASGPTLKALSSGLSGLLGKGLPDMFNGLKTGIPGTAKMLDGLFSLINNLLGGLGRLSGEFGRTLGPVFGDAFKTTGGLIAGAMDTIRGAMILLRPVFRDVAFGFKTIMDVGRIIGPTLADAGIAILGAFAPVGDSVNRAVGPLQALHQWVQQNKIGITEYTRIFAIGMIDITGAAIQAAPQIIQAFKYVSAGVLTAIDGLVSGAAKAFGNLPVIGDKFKEANKSFDKFKNGFIAGLDTAQKKAGDFAAATGPRLERNKLQVNINNWNSQLETAKAKLKTVPPSKQAALKATIRDLQSKVAEARRQLNNIDGKTATTYVKTVYQRAEANTAPYFRRTGGPAPRFAGGGMPGGRLRGPGTGTSDSIPMWWASTGEYIVNAKSTAKYGPLIEAINSGTLGSGGGLGALGGAGLDVGKGLIKGMDAAAAGVGTAAHRMAAAITTGIRDEMEIRSPSKKTKALAADIGKGLIVGLTGTQAKIKSVAADLVKDIKTAFSGKKESSLVKYVNQQTDKLLAAAKKRDALEKKIAEAKKYASDTTATGRQQAGLSALGMAPEEVTAGGIKAGLAQKLAQIKQFSKYISELAKRGLNKGLLRQILDMGPVDGYAYASALAGASKSTISSINSTQKQIDSQTTSLGRKGADLLYDSGKNASKGFLTGLLSQEKELEKTMEKLAKSMQKALRKALGIKSPATKVVPDGINTTRGVAKGVLAGLPFIDRAMDTVAGRITGRVAGTRPVLGRPAVTAGRGGVMYVQVDVNGATDPVATARELRRTLLELKRDYGMNVDLGLGA